MPCGQQTEQKREASTSGCVTALNRQSLMGKDGMWWQQQSAMLTCCMPPLKPAAAPTATPSPKCMLAWLDAGPMPHEPPAAITKLVDVIDVLVDLLIDLIMLYVPHICINVTCTVLSSRILLPGRQHQPGLLQGIPAYCQVLCSLLKAYSTTNASANRFLAKTHLAFPLPCAANPCRVAASA